jgi:hypothetical protein
MTVPNSASEMTSPAPNPKLPRIAWWFSFTLLLGCASEAEEPAPGQSSDPTCPNEPTAFSITDDTNYTFTSTVAVEMATLKSATDLRFDWSALTQDFFGQPIDPATDIDMVLISLWNLTPEALAESVARDQLDRNASEGAIMTYPDGSYTSQNLLSFGLLGNPLPDEDEIWKRFDTNHPEFEYPQDQYTFLMTASSGTSPGKGSRMLGFFNLDPSSSVTELSLTNDSTLLDYTVDLARMNPVRVPTGQPSLTVDWSQMTVNALGNQYLANQITQARIAHFETTSLAELEAGFLNLEEMADRSWSGEIAAGTSIDLGLLTDETGAPFPGIDDTGTWFVALFCTVGDCNNPAPWSITALSPCE